MDLIINLLYSDRDVFLRELVSNAGDACDKKWFLSITLEGEDGTQPPQIKIKADIDNNTLFMEDSGAGMIKYELVRSEKEMDFWKRTDDNSKG